jgi:hypothetical protein
MVPAHTVATVSPDVHLIALQAICDRLERIEAQLGVLTEAWAQFRPVAEAYSRGGMLGARTAMRRARNERAG